MPVSAPFFTPSVQLGPAHIPPMHTPFWQSPLTAQLLLSAHVGQAPPPQSMSVSAPFLRRSVQLGAAHTLAAHTPLWQSPLTMQPWPLGQVAHMAPPQSTP